MRKERIELLKRDLYARIPYGVKAKAIYIAQWTTDFSEVEGVVQSAYGNNVVISGCHCELKNTVLFLRPMSSMDDDDKMKYVTLTHYNKDENGNPYKELTPQALDWLNANHFDYRGLIEKGLALEAPDDMYTNIKRL